MKMLCLEHKVYSSIRSGMLRLHIFAKHRKDGKHYCLPDETIRKPLSNFQIRETEMIQLASLLISFNGKVATLEKDRNRISKPFRRCIRYR